jgi:uncharacterized protein YybS (DUF2232 family)
MFASMFFFGKVSFVDLSGFRETDSFVAQLAKKFPVFCLFIYLFIIVCLTTLPMTKVILLQIIKWLVNTAFERMWMEGVET